MEHKKHELFRLIPDTYRNPSNQTKTKYIILARHPGQRYAVALDVASNNWVAMTAIARLRSITGVVLMAYVLCHLLNHAFGLQSIDAMQRAHGVLMSAWRTWPGTILLAGSLAAHFSVALWAVYHRRTMRMTSWEAAQLISGLILPILLTEHIIGTRIAEEVAGVDPTYGFVITAMWVLSPISGATQAVATVVAWIHGVAGLHFWLRTKPWYPKIQRQALVVAIVVPVVSLAGFVAAGFRVLNDPNARQLVEYALRDAEMARLESLVDSVTPVMITLAAIAASPFVARTIRNRYFTGSKVTLILPDGAKIPVPQGATALEALRAVNRPHAAVCGGRGRCTTCRVRIMRGAELLEEPEDLEQLALSRIKALDGIRLACQIRPKADLGVTPLLPPTASARDGRRPGGLDGEERNVSCLFIDIRGSTKLGEEKLPYDVLFILNQFFSEMSQAIEETNGHYSQFAGDGLMALYGLTGSEKEGAQAALRGAKAMLVRVDGLNESLETELPFPLKVGIGLHFGEAIVGAMGPPKSQITSAIGDTINTTARLESLTKDHGTPLIVSEDLARAAGLSLPLDTRAEVQVRGRTAPVGFFGVTDVAEIAV